MDKIIEHKESYAEGLRKGLCDESVNNNLRSVDSSSPYFVSLNEAQTYETLGYSIGSVIRSNIDNSVINSGNSGTVSPTHNHDDRYSLLGHNHDERYYTKVEEDIWRDKLINGNLLFNKINANHIQAGSITAGSGIIANGAIGSAHISKLEADKIEGGTIDTSKLTIAGSNGNLLLRGNRLQVFEGIGSNRFERVSLGDVNNDGTVYGFRVRGADGETVLLDENGVTSEGITNGSITDEKISGEANIDGSKINITSVIHQINNNNEERITSHKIDIDNETLSSKISNIVMTQNEQQEKIINNTASIESNSKAIALKVDEQIYSEDLAGVKSTLEKQTGEIKVLKDGISLSATKTEVTNQIKEVTDFVADEIGDISVGGANYLNNSAPRKAIVDEFVNWDRTLNGKHRLSNWNDFRDDVELPSIGYHAHIDLSTFHFPCIALINRNATWEMANRYLGIVQEISKQDEFFRPDEYYTISFDAYSDVAPFNFHGGLYHKVNESETYGYHSGYMNVSIPKENVSVWRRYSYTFKTHKGINVNDKIYFEITGHNNLEASSYIKNIKLESGNKYSQWTPSQFDLDDSLNDIIDSTKDYTNESIKTLSSSIDIKLGSITSTVSSTQKDLNSVKSEFSEIKQTTNSITSTVSGLEGKYTEIKQKVDEIDITGVVKFTDLSNKAQNTFINGGNIQTNTISVDSLKSNNDNPIIRLFDKCSIDATDKDEKGKGNSIRLKYDAENYIKVSPTIFKDNGEKVEANISFFSGLNPDNEVFIFRGNAHWGRIICSQGELLMDANNISYQGTKLSKEGHTHTGYASSSHTHSEYSKTDHTHSEYASSSHTHSNYATTSSLSSYALKSSSNYLKTGSIDPYSSGTYNLGYSGAKWNQVSAKAIWGDTGSVSDISTKENVRYLDNDTMLLNENLDTKQDTVLSKEDLFNFIKNDLKLTQYNYISEYAVDNFNNKLNFIANDIVDTKVGSIICAEHEGHLAYNLNNYVSVLAGALQEEIKKREELEERVLKLEELLMNRGE